MSDNKALADRLNAAWEKLYGDGDEHGVCDDIAEAEAALREAEAAISPQADKARGEVVAWMVTRERDPSFPRLFTKEADANLWIARVQLYPFAEKVPLYTAPQPQGDASGQVSGGGEASEHVEVLRRLEKALPTVGLNGWAKGVEAVRYAIAALSTPQARPDGVSCGKCGVRQPLQHSPDCGRSHPAPALDVALDAAFVARLANNLVAAGWDVDPDCDGSGIAQLREAFTAAQQGATNGQE